MFSRRLFLQRSGLAGLGLGLGFSNAAQARLSIDSGEFTPEALLRSKLNSDDPVNDELFWKLIRKSFNPADGFINLENGYFSPQPLSTLTYHQERERYVNSYTSWYMRREMSGSFEKVRKDLATFLGVDPEELALTRNTTESLNTIILGYPWKAGDEVVIGNQDYGSMVEAFRQAEKRYGIVIREASVPLTPANDEEVIDAYLKLCTRKTKFVHLTHLINLSGQVIPVAKIADRAHEQKIEVVVDAAHSVAQLDFKLPDLRADYVGASLHKWLCCPLGNGFLWMNKAHIPKIWPLMGDTGLKETDIRRFEHHGTRPFQTNESISKAISFHETIGSKLKQDRLKTLMKSWVSQVYNLPGVTINTPWQDDQRNSALVNIAVQGYTPAALSEKLLKDFGIFTVAIDHPAIKGVRVTPHLYNTLEEVNQLAAAIKTISK
jgi:selenocysteine lyase/cysteine desulfurase